MIGSRGSTVLIALLLSAAVHAVPAAAQELTGVAIGPDGQPISGAPVALHRVGGGSGAFVGSDTTGPEGEFRFELQPDSAVYFAALRYSGRMYIGPTVRPGTVPIADYVLRVDPANEAGAVASGMAGQAQAPPPRTSAPPADSDAGALLLVGLLALAAAAAFFFAAPRYRHRRTREALIELAALENALADATEEDDTARLRADRDRLRASLAPRP